MPRLTHVFLGHLEFHPPVLVFWSAANSGETGSRT